MDKSSPTLARRGLSELTNQRASYSYGLAETAPNHVPSSRAVHRGEGRTGVSGGKRAGQRGKGKGESRETKEELDLQREGIIWPVRF